MAPDSLEVKVTRLDGRIDRVTDAADRIAESSKRIEDAMLKHVDEEREIRIEIFQRMNKQEQLAIELGTAFKSHIQFCESQTATAKDTKKEMAEWIRWVLPIAFAAGVSYIVTQVKG